MARDDRPVPDRPAGPAVARDRTPGPVRAAGVLVGLQALAALGFAAVLAVRVPVAELGVRAAVGEAGFFALVAAALGAVAAGLVRGRPWARTPAIVTQLLLLPVVYSLLGPSHQLLPGVAGGAVVFAALMLLLNERSRRWAAGEGRPDGR